jgi:magnesium chelatase subunit I
VINVFKSGVSADTGEMMPVGHYQDMLKQVDGLPEAIEQVTQDKNPATQASAVEFVLEGLHLNKRLNKDSVSGQTRYRG